MFLGYYIGVEFIICPAFGLISFYHTIEYIIPTMAFSYMAIQYYLCNVIIANRFLMLNVILMEMDVSQSTSTYRRNVIITKFKLFLENVMDVHDQLSTITRNLNDYYSLQLLIAIVVLCSLIIVNGYIIIYTMTLSFNGELFYVIYPGFKLILICTIVMLLFINGSAKVSNQVHRYLVTSLSKL